MQVGDTVSLRVATPLGPSDLVGTLLSATGGVLVIRRRDGGVVEVEERTISARRVVPPGPARTISAAELEQVAAQGWRAAEEERRGSWLLRASGGFTRRGNSALAVGDPGTPAADAVEAVRGWYGARGLRPCVQVVAAATPAGVQEVLDGAGWTVEAPTSVLTAELGPVLRATDGQPAMVDVRLDPAPDDAWLALFRPDSTAARSADALQLLTRHDSVAFASIRDGDRCAAIARVCVDGRWAGLSCVEVATDRRRAGFGRTVGVEALRWAVSRGARRGYRQVEQDNVAARSLYEGMGFVEHHDYVYRVGSVEV